MNSTNLQARLARLEATAGVGSGVATVHVHWSSDLPPVRRIPGNAVVYVCGVKKGDSPFRRLHAVPKRFPPEADRRPGSPTPKRAAVILGRLVGRLDGKQRKLVGEAAFVVVV